MTDHRTYSTEQIELLIDNEQTIYAFVSDYAWHITRRVTMSPLTIGVNVKMHLRSMFEYPTEPVPGWGDWMGSPAAYLSVAAFDQYAFLMRDPQFAWSWVNDEALGQHMRDILLDGYQPYRSVSWIGREPLIVVHRPLPHTGGVF